jgi:hypothetical protein
MSQPYSRLRHAAIMVAATVPVAHAVWVVEEKRFPPLRVVKLMTWRVALCLK